jgi:hypothetical protein
VNNQLGASQGFEGFRTQQTVGVGNQADPFHWGGHTKSYRNK